MSLKVLFDEGYVRDSQLACEFLELASMPITLDASAWRGTNWTSLAARNVSGSAESQLEMFPLFARLIGQVLVETYATWSEESGASKEQRQAQSQQLDAWLAVLRSQAAKAQGSMDR